jgi:hypothetical protein
MNNDERYELIGLVDATMAPNGEIFVVPYVQERISCGQVVRVFDSAGRFLRQFGRAGDGPGEYDCITRISLVGRDSIMVQDGRRRMTLLDVRGTVLASKDLARGTNICCFRDGGYITSPDNLSAFIGGRGRNRPPITFHAFRVAGDTAARRSAVVATGDTALRIQMGPARGQGWWQPGSPYARTAFVAIAGDEIIHGLPDAYEYHVYSRDGRHTRTVRAALPPRPVTRADQDAWKESLLAVSKGFDAEGRMRALSLSLPFPATMPAFGDVRADTYGNVWLRSYLNRDETAASYWWAKFDANGRLLGTLKPPANRTVRRFDGDFVFLTERDSTTDMTRLHVHRVEVTRR